MCFQATRTSTSRATGYKEHLIKNLREEQHVEVPLLPLEVDKALLHYILQALLVHSLQVLLRPTTLTVKQADRHTHYGTQGNHIHISCGGFAVVVGSKRDQK